MPTGLGDAHPCKRPTDGLAFCMDPVWQMVGRAKVEPLSNRPAARQRATVPTSPGRTGRTYMRLPLPPASELPLSNMKPQARLASGPYAVPDQYRLFGACENRLKLLLCVVPIGVAVFPPSSL